MVFASPESTAEAGQLRSAVAGQSDSVSSRMFNEARDYQVANQANSVGRGGNSDSNSASSDNRNSNSCLSAKDIQKMMNEFKIEDKNSDKSVYRLSNKPLLNEDENSDKSIYRLSNKPLLNPIGGLGYGIEPWSPELGACAPGSPYKIDCHDDKEQKLRTK